MGVSKRVMRLRIGVSVARVLVVVVISVVRGVAEVTVSMIFVAALRLVV